MGFVIKLKHREGKRPMYVAAVPVATDENDEDVLKLKRKGIRIVPDIVNTAFDSLEEASKFPYSDAEVAAVVVLSLPETQNIDYEVVPAIVGKSQVAEGEPDNGQ
jgi:hypothetical protein